MNIIPYTREAYEMRKYAFVSDYARFYILYCHGGLYFDTDVEVIHQMNDIVERGAFMGCENEVGQGRGNAMLAVAPGLGLGCPPQFELYAEILDIYAGLHFRRAGGGLNLKTVVEYTTELLMTKGLRNVNEVQQVAGVWIYPKEYFCPMSYRTNAMELTENTRSIHHYAASWYGTRQRIKIKFIQMLGPRLVSWGVSLKYCIKRSK